MGTKKNGLDIIESMSAEELDSLIEALRSYRAGRYGKNEVDSATASMSAQEFFEKRAIEHLKALGVKQHFKGYVYLIEALVEVAQNHELVHHMMYMLYPNVAEAFNTTATVVERNLRTVIRDVFLKGDIKTIWDYFGNASSSKKRVATNGQFVATLANRMAVEWADYKKNTKN